MLLFTIGWFTLFSVLAGLTASYAQLLAVRVLQGLGFGGEWAVGATLMAEVMAPANRGKAVGLVQSGFSFGWAFASISATVILALFPQALAWRIALWFCVVPALAVVFIRRNLQEPAIFLERKRTASTGAAASFGSVFRRDVARHTVLASAVVLGFQASSFAIINWLPTLLIQVRHLSPGQVVVTMLIITGGAFAGFLFNADACDRYGRKPTLLAFSAAAWVVSCCYMFIPMPPVLLTTLGFAVGFTVNGMFASVGPFLSELFPTEIRTTCMAFSYNLGKSAGAFAVVLVGMLSAYMPLAHAIGAFCFVGYAISMAALLLLPETLGRDLGVMSTEGQRTLPAHGAVTSLVRPFMGARAQRNDEAKPLAD